LKSNHPKTKRRRHLENPVRGTSLAADLAEVVAQLHKHGLPVFNHLRL
jgi:hypothetical protein